MFVKGSKTQAAEAGGGCLGNLELVAAQGHVRIIRFNSISSINDILGNNRYSISPSS